MEILDKESIYKYQITKVILTHLHPDHVGGIYNETGLINFPKAKFFIHEDEWNFWYSSKSDDQPPIFRYFIENNVSGLKDMNIELIKGEEKEILPGIRLFSPPATLPAKFL